MTAPTTDGEPTRSLSEQLLDYYRRVAAEHANDVDTGLCPICAVDHCGAGRFAIERLLCATRTIGSDFGV